MPDRSTGSCGADEMAMTIGSIKVAESGSYNRPISCLAWLHRVRRLLKNYLRCHCGVKNRPRHGVSKCSFTARKLRFFACFCLALAASPTFFNGLLIHLAVQAVAQPVVQIIEEAGDTRGQRGV